MTIAIAQIGLAKPDDDVIAQCRDLLAMAESGEIRSLIYAVEHRNGSCTTSLSATLDVMKMVGQCHRMAHRLQLDIDADAVVTTVDAS